MIDLLIGCQALVPFEQADTQLLPRRGTMELSLQRDTRPFTT